MDGNLTSMEICVRCCEMDVRNMERFSRTWPYTEYSGMVFPGPYNAIISMTAWLEDPITHDVFTRAAALLAITARELVMPRIVLRAVRALVWTLKKTIPPRAQQYFKGIDRDADDPNDVPMEFVLPDQVALRELLAEDLLDTTSASPLGMQLGDLIKRWTTLSIE
jgi:hypothetical protein